MKETDIRWRHSIKLSDGTITKGTKNTFIDLQQFCFPENLFRDKIVFDVGCCDGFFCKHAFEQGAKDVCGYDNYRWTFDIDRWNGMRGFEKMRLDSGYPIRASTIPMEEINPDTVGYCDVLLFLGVFYHLPHPTIILDNISKCCKQTLVLETLIDPYCETLKVPSLKFYPEGFKNQDGTVDLTTYWTPNTLWLNQYLKRIGFQTVETRIIYGGWRAICYAKDKDPNYKSDWGEW